MSAAIIAVSHRTTTPSGAASMLRAVREATAHDLAWPGYDPVLSQAVLRRAIALRPSLDGYIQALDDVRSTIRSRVHEPGRVVPFRVSATPGAPWSPLLTEEGFLNLAQAVALRLRYEDPRRSDCIDAIDVY